MIEIEFGTQFDRKGFQLQNFYYMWIQREIFLENRVWYRLNYLQMLEVHPLL